MPRPHNILSNIQSIVQKTRFHENTAYFSTKNLLLFEFTYQILKRMTLKIGQISHFIFFRLTKTKLKSCQHCGRVGQDNQPVQIFCAVFYFNGLCLFLFEYRSVWNFYQDYMAFWPLSASFFL